MKRLTIIAATLAATLSLGAKTQFFEHSLTFPKGATDDMKVELASRVVPTANQLQWQNLELTAFLHFGVNTFTGREWGDGKETEDTFNPTDLDAEQWVRTLKEAGFNLVILTAKHHDGFCLWPTKTTKHCVANSKWKDGKGDVVRELRDACDKYGMKLGLYLSPWDRNAECYGDSPKYNDMFVAQLTELLTNYGTVDEVWFDGACGEGPNGKKQEYDWTRFKETIRTLQPNAVLAITGDDVRWVGNEGGVGRETEWSVTPLTPAIFPEAKEANGRLGINDMSTDIGSRELLVKADKMYWWPSEVDVSIRPGWFYHSDEQPKSLAHLSRIYLESVGRNSVLLLNIPPDKRGRIAECDSLRLMEFHRWVQKSFTDNKITGKHGNNHQILTFDKPAKVNCVQIEEDIAKGQRIEQFEVIVKAGKGFKVVGKGTTVGYKRMITFPAEETSEVRVVVKAARGIAIVKDLSAYLLADVAEEETTDNLQYLPSDGWKAQATDTSIEIDFGAPAQVSGFIYTPKPGSSMAFKYRVWVSEDGKEWKRCGAPDEFSNIENNPIPQKVSLDHIFTTRYVKIDCVEAINGLSGITLNELKFF